MCWNLQNGEGYYEGQTKLFSLDTQDWSVARAVGIPLTTLCALEK